MHLIMDYKLVTTHMHMHLIMGYRRSTTVYAHAPDHELQDVHYCVGICP